MTGPIAYHLNWTAYGTWLPGDERGWTDGAPVPPRSRMNYDATSLGKR